MRMLVTGATGFIGGHLAQRLRTLGHEVRGLVRSDGKGAELKRIGVELIRGDVTLPASLAPAVRGIEIVFHTAALVTDWGPWPAFQSVTVDGTTNMLQAAAEAKVARFLHVSTANVYEDRTARKLRVITEEAPHQGGGDRAYGYYSSSKVLAEDAVRKFQNERGLPATIVRPTWVYGPGDYTILPRLLEHLESRFSFWIGGRNPVVDPIYVTDVVECAILAATMPIAVGQAYNVSPDREIRLRDFLGRMCAEMRLPVPRWAMPLAVARAAAFVMGAYAKLTRSLDPPALTRAGLALFSDDQHFSSAKAARELCWKPKVDVEAGARSTVEWLNSVRAKAANLPR
jgi:nucleoside-diphosphate-sugar epimerase